MNEIIGKKIKEFDFPNGQTLVVVFYDGWLLEITGEKTDSYIVGGRSQYNFNPLIGFPVTHYEGKEIYAPPEYTAIQTFWSGFIKHDFIWACYMLPVSPILEKTWRTA
jgi:hypothetical protein